MTDILYNGSGALQRQDDHKHSDKAYAYCTVYLI